jgi:hypothetical protein
MKRLLLFLIVSLGACSQGKISERDMKRQQQQDQANLKRQELSTVAGAYGGELKNQADNVNMNVLLNLEVKDIPDSSVEGVDPVLIPKIVGNLRIYAGAAGGTEFWDAAIVESEYKPAQNLVSLVVQQEQFGRMILQLDIQDEGKALDGTWSANAGGKTGTVRVTKEGNAS